MTKTLNAIEPTPQQIRNFLAANAPGTPVYMLNLLKFKEKATYKVTQKATNKAVNTDREDISGREAYNRYASAFSRLAKDQGIEGFEVSFSGNITAFMIGNMADMVDTDRAALQTDENDTSLWDAAAIVRYPDAQTMFELVSSEAYRKIHKHRRAGLAGQLLISCDHNGPF